MRSCPNCHRSVAEGARVCRACYTILPEEDHAAAALHKKRTGSLSGLKQLFVIFAVAGGAWLLQLDVKQIPAIRAQIVEAQQSSGWLFGQWPNGGVQQPHGRAGERGAGQGAYERVQAKSVAREGRQCAITQGIRNLDEKPLSGVVLKFTFEDALGSPIGSGTDATIAAVLKPGAERTFTFRLPCPRSFARVTARVPTGEAQKTALIMSTFAEDSPELSRLAVEVVDASVCPPPKPCELLVRSHRGGTALYRFHRDPTAPEMLITEDSILIGHLRRHMTAWLQVPSPSGGADILLTDQNLRATRQPGKLARWIGKLF